MVVQTFVFQLARGSSASKSSLLSSPPSPLLSSSLPSSSSSPSCQTISSLSNFHSSSPSSNSSPDDSTSHSLSEAVTLSKMSVSAMNSFICERRINKLVQNFAIKSKCKQNLSQKDFPQKSKFIN